MKLKSRITSILLLFFIAFSQYSLAEITGNTNVCVNETSRYSTAVPGTKTWEVKGGTIVADKNDFIDVKWTQESPYNQVKYKVMNHNSNQMDSTVLSVNVKPIEKPYLSGDKSVCAGAEEYYVFSASSDDYEPEWKVINGTIISNNTHTIRVKWQNKSGKGLVIMNNTNQNICAKSDTMIVEIVSPPFVQIWGREQACRGNYEIFSVKEEENDTYFWSSPKGKIWGSTTASTVNVLWDELGTDSISVTVSNNRTGCIRKYSKAVNINNIPKVELAPFDPICVSGEKIKLTGGTPEGGTYSGGYYIRDNVFNVAFAGVGKHLIRYTYTTKNGNCSGSDTAYITVLPIPNKPLIFYEEEILYTNLNHGIQWFLGGVAIEGATSKTYEPEETGYYSVKGKNELGCFSPKSDSIFVEVSSSVKQLKNSPISLEVKSGSININSPKNIANITVYNLLGTSVFSSEINALNYKINAQNLNKGVYFVKIMCEDGTAYYKKLIL